jgi:hypothetical protein
MLFPLQDSPYQRPHISHLRPISPYRPNNALIIDSTYHRTPLVYHFGSVDSARRDLSDYNTEFWRICTFLSLQLSSAAYHALDYGDAPSFWSSIADTVISCHSRSLSYNAFLLAGALRSRIRLRQELVDFRAYFDPVGGEYTRPRVILSQKARLSRIL